MTIAEIRTELAELLEGENLNVYKYVKGKATAPAILIIPANNFQEKKDYCAREYNFELTCIQANVNNENTQQKMDEMIDETIDKIDSTEWLIKSVSGYFKINVNGIDFLAATIEVNNEY